MKPIGLISDTHGLLRPQALAALAGCTQILHAGDICGPEVLQALRALAPVTAVRGNNDQGVWAEALPPQCTLDVDGVRIHMLHDLKDLAMDPKAQGVRLVLSGHSHKPQIRAQDGVLYVNPGSAGPRRFALPVSVGRLWVREGQPQVELHTLRV